MRATAPRTGIPHAGKDMPGFGHLILALGLASIILPTLASLGRWSWSTDTGAHGPIVLATGLWLLWHDRRFLADAKPAPSYWGYLLIACALPLYFLGRVTQIVALEGAVCIILCVATAAQLVGWRCLSRYWFHVVYLAFMLVPPENWIFVATRPIKSLLAESAVAVMSGLGLNIGGSASMILVDGYQMQVAAACSGVNSLLGITAIGLFYVYLRHGDQPRYAALLVALLLPIAIITNFLRIIALILSIHWTGDGTVFAFTHDAGGVVMFAIALGLLFLLDELLAPASRSLGLLR